MENGHLFCTQLFQGTGRHFTLVVIPRAGTEEVGHALGGEAHGRGAVGNLHDAGLVEDALGGLGDGGTIGADQYYILEKGKVTASELADKFEVSVRTIYRDIERHDISGL